MPKKNCKKAAMKKVLSQILSDLLIKVKKSNFFQFLAIFFSGECFCSFYGSEISI